MIERLSMEENYSENESAIHLSRYSIAKKYCKDKIILDISCGEGYGSKLLKEWGAKKVIGLDISKDAIEKAINNFKTENLDYIVHDAMKLECFEDNYFDMIVSFETIEHLEEPLKFLKEIKRVSKENAEIIISCPNDYLYYPSDDQKNPYHIKKYTFLDFKDLIMKVFNNNLIKYLIGTRVEGYINLFMNENNALLKQKDMIKPVSEINCNKIFSELLTDENNCSYYVALININNIEENANIFPETLKRWIDDPIDYRKIKQLEHDSEIQYLKENIARLTSEVKNLNNKINSKKFNFWRKKK